MWHQLGWLLFGSDMKRVDGSEPSFCGSGRGPSWAVGRIPYLGFLQGCNHWLGSGMVTAARWSRGVNLGPREAEISGVVEKLPLYPESSNLDICSPQLKIPALFSHTSTTNVPSSLNLLFEYIPTGGSIRPHVRLQPPEFLPFHSYRIVLSADAHKYRS